VNQGSYRIIIPFSTRHIAGTVEPRTIVDACRIFIKHQLKGECLCDVKAKVSRDDVCSPTDNCQPYRYRTTPPKSPRRNRLPPVLLGGYALGKIRTVEQSERSFRNPKQTKRFQRLENKISGTNSAMIIDSVVYQMDTQSVLDIPRIESWLSYANTTDRRSIDFARLTLERCAHPWYSPYDRPSLEWVVVIGSWHDYFRDAERQDSFPSSR